MNIIAVTGAGGGAGITTVAAHLAAALVMHDRQCIAIDASPRNALRLHFGMAWEDGSGLASQVIAGQPWNEAAFRSPSGVDFLPMGRGNFDAWLAERPGWFGESMAEVDLPEETFAICDCPPCDSAFKSQILSTADLAVVVLTPDSLSYATAESARLEAIASGADEACLLLNKFDSTRMLDRDIQALMSSDFRDDFLPIFVHRDESVREAVANKQTVFDYAASCQAASDFSALALWLVAHFSSLREEAA